ncbi:hypothetical protein ACKWTF_016658 [Chironomus riparius]
MSHTITMSIKRIRNENFEPFINNEGFYKDRGLDRPPSIQNLKKEEEMIRKGKAWYESLDPHFRLYYHNTLSSARRHANFMNVKSPKDSLDIILASEYDHSNDLFLKKQEVFTQPETIEKMTFRRLKNTRDVKIEPPVYLSHPLKRGGITERLSTHSVKLINSGPHSQITNHGFSRQNVDGNFYNY